LLLLILIIHFPSRITLTVFVDLFLGFCSLYSNRSIYRIIVPLWTTIQLNLPRLSANLHLLTVFSIQSKHLCNFFLFNPSILTKIVWKDHPRKDTIRLIVGSSFMNRLKRATLWNSCFYNKDLKKWFFNSNCKFSLIKITSKQFN
jgi:hypothetical protein